MKCKKCGAELLDGVAFCRECGTKVEKRKRFCRECGKEFPEGAKFCTYCGASLETELTSKGQDGNEGSANITEDHNVVHITLTGNKAVDDSIANKSLKEEKNEGAENNQLSSGANNSNVEIKEKQIDINKNERKLDNSKEVATSSNSKSNKSLLAIIFAMIFAIIKGIYLFIKEKFLLIWNKLDKFGKVIYLLSIAVVLFMVAALNSKKAIPITISLVQVVLVVILWLMHYGTINTGKRWVKTVVLSLLCALFVFNYLSYSIKIVKKVKVYTPMSAEACVGKTYDEIASIFKKAGFYKIEQEVINDLEYNEIDKDGFVESIAIDNDDSFDENQKFYDNANVVVKYHSFKLISIPFSSEEVKTMDTDELITALTDLGFVNIETEEENDLDPDKTDNEFENTVSINKYYRINKSDLYPLDSKILITTHRPYKKYTLKLNIDLSTGFLYSEYAVNVIVNGEKTELTEDSTNSLEYRLQEGEYDIEFVNDNQKSIKEKVTLDITSDTEISYTVNRYSNSIDLQTDAFYRNEILSDNEATIPVSHSYCKYKDYKEIQQKFIDAGFTNISTEILYDIIWGWTKEGEIDEVTINNSTDFIQGNIALKDSPIVITYHMNEEDDPAKQMENKSDESIEIEWPLMEGTSLDAISKEVEEFGLKLIYDGETLGEPEGDRYADYQTEDYKLSLTVSYAQGNKELLCVTILTSNAVATDEEQKDFIVKLAPLCCPEKDSEAVSKWVEENIGKESKIKIGEFTYELRFGTNGNFVYNAGTYEWEEWTLNYE